MRTKFYILLILTTLSSSVSAYAQKGIVNKGANIYIKNNGIINLQNGDYTNETNGSDGKISIEGKFYLGGNWINNASGILNTSSRGIIILNSSSAQSIGGTTANQINAILVQNTNNVSLGNNLIIDSLIDFSSGKFNLSNYTLSLSSSASLKNYSASKYIIAENNGKLEQSLSNTSKIYPLGTSSSYNPVYIKNSGTTDIFGFRIQQGVLSAGTSGSAQSAHLVDKTWVLSENTAGGSNLDIAFQWNSANEAADFIRDTCGIGQYLSSSSKWETQLAGQASGINPYQRSIAGVVLDNGDNAFIVGDKYSSASDGTPPKMTNVAIASNHTNTNWARAGSIVTLSMTADETLSSNPTVIFRIGGKLVTNAISITDLGSNNYTAQFSISGSDNEGNITFTINFTDKKGNKGDEVNSTTNNSSVQVDLTQPTISFIQIYSNNANADSLAKTSDVATLNFALSEANDALPTVIISGNAASVSNVSSLNFKGTYTFTGTNAEGIVPFSIQYKDSAGNSSPIYSSITAGHTLRFDRTIPSLSTVTLITNNSNDNQLATKGDVITLSFTSSENLKASPAVSMSIGGSAISGFTLSPTAVANSYTITYTISPTDNDGALSFQINFEDKAGNTGTMVSTTTNGSAVNVDVALPTASTAGATEICQNDSTKITIDLSGDTPWNLIYTDGSTNTTVNGITTSPYEFYVKTAGTYKVTQLSDASGHFAVDFGTSATIIVNPLPTPSFSTSFTTYNTSDAPEVLSGTPAGGTFSGLGITSQDSTFHPDIAGPAANSEIKYTYTDTNYCTNSYLVFVDILKSDANITSINSVYCYDSTSDTIIGTNPKSIIGLFSIAGGSGLIDNGDNTATLTPSLIGSGTDTITYRYFDNTWLSTKKIIRIDSLGTALDFVGLDTAYCADQTAISLIGTNMYPANGNLHWTGPAPEFPATSNTKSFTPSLLAADSTYSISIQYESPDNCFSQTVTKNFKLNPLPVLSFNLKDNYNIDSSAVTLVATPSGGTFSGSGISGNLFVPSVVGVNSSVTLNYTYTDNKGCTSSISSITETRKANSLFSSLSNAYCYADTSIKISIIPENNSQTIRFTSFNNGIISFSGDTAIYNPSWAGNGQDTITYVYNLRGTEYKIKGKTYVDSIGNINFIDLASEYCEGDSIVPLTGIFNHPDGSGTFTFSGSGTAFANYGNTATFRPITVIADNAPRTITYTYTSNISACKKSVSKQTIVHPLPVIDFNLAQNYNVNGQSDTLEAIPSGGSFSGQGMSGDIFYPNLAGIGSGFNITYLYKEPVTGCQNKITKITNVQEADAVILGIDSNNIYCYDATQDTLYGKAINGLPGGFFSGQGITNLTPDTALFSPTVAGNGHHLITYFYIGTDSVTQFTTQEDIWVDSIGEASIVGLAPAYCADEPQFTVFGSPQTSNGSFFGSGLIDNANGTAIFTASLANIGPNIINYIYTNPQSGCSVSDTKTVVIHALPLVDFSISDQCIADSIRFTDNTVTTDAISNWYWNFGDNDNLLKNESNLQKPTHLYTTDGSKQIKLEVTTNAGCKNNIIKIIDFGSSPVADFSWSNECFGLGPTQFTNNSSGGNIISYKWNFDDGQSSTQIAPGHQFDSVANYSVSLIVKTLNNCVDTSKQTVYLRPYVSNYPYMEDFETGKNGWVALAPDSINSWKWGTPVGAIIDTAASGSKAWCTGLADNYKNNEKSYVIGPCFDFSGMKKPMIGLKYFLQTYKGDDGAVLQYSIDNGQSWQSVGGLDDGINWYNSYIQSSPGGQQQGWSGDTIRHWVEARHDLNKLVGISNVRFRIAFGSDVYNNKEGFAFDDIYIGERKRQVVLENFVNSSDYKSRTTESNIESLITQYPLDVTSLYYHTNTLGDDPFYSQNPDIPDAKALYYSISGTPYSIMDGKNRYNFKSTLWTANDLMLRALVEPKFSLSATAFINNGSDIWVDIDLNATDSVKNNIVVQTIITETVNGIIIGANGQSDFNNVVRDIIPDASGTLITKKWIKGDSYSLHLEKKLPFVNDINNIRIVIYVQDFVTHEIYQSATINNSGISTNINNQISKKLYELMVYPNPVRDNVSIKIPKIKEDAVIYLLDNFGRIMKTINLKPNIQEVVINLEFYRAGVFIVRYQSKSGIKLSKKIIKL